MRHKTRRDILLVAAFGLLSLILAFVPTGFGDRVDKDALRCRGRVVAVDNTGIRQFGMIKTGDQGVGLEILNGRFKGQILQGNNPLLGQLDRDKVFAVGDTALVVLTLDTDGRIVFVNPQAHYRVGLELMLLGMFVVVLLVFGGWTGAKAMLSFVFSALMLWKILVPCMLKGYDPVYLSLTVVTLLTAIILFLVAGLTSKGLVAFLGALLGVASSCVLSFIFTRALHIHGAVMPFSETLLYSGFGHLDLTRIYMAAVFLAASGAVMDLAMDVAASLDEVSVKKPEMGSGELLKSGLSIGRSVVGTMTTTLLLAYSGGYITLLMAFMAQGIPLTNLFNLVYVAAEVLKTLVGSFGLVMVAPFTALVGALVYGRQAMRRRKPQMQGDENAMRAMRTQPSGN
jgi:uncharacterized membrane protein